MKKTILFISLFMLFSFSVYAECKDDELNEWASNVKVELIPFDEDKEGVSENDNYAYLISITPMRDDITFKAKDMYDEIDEARKIKGYDIMAVGGYTSLSDNMYTIYLYGEKNSACPNELLRTISYTVPKYNDYIDTTYCDNYPDAEICNPFKNTDDVDLEKFEKEIDDYKKEHEEPAEKSILSIIWEYFLEYALYAIIPIVIIVVVYKIRVKNYIRKEREK